MKIYVHAYEVNGEIRWHSGYFTDRKRAESAAHKFNYEGLEEAQYMVYVREINPAE